MQDIVLRNILTNTNINNTEKVLLLSLLLDANDNCIQISFKKISEKINTSRRVVIANINGLIAKGLLEKENQTNEDNGKLSNKYTIKISEENK